MSEEKKEKKSRRFEYTNVYKAALTIDAKGTKLQPGDTILMLSSDAEKYNGMLKRV